MGSGKTTVGRLLADEYGMVFKDTDVLITEREGRSIPEIFAAEGEAYFRKLEHELVAELAEDDGDYRIILSTGGGLPVDERNRELLKKIGTVVYLRARAESLYERVKNDTGRPLLVTDDRLKRITGMLKERGPIYETAADVIIDTDELGAEDVVLRISQKVLEI